MDDLDLMDQLCKHLDPKESLWRAIGGSYGLSNNDLEFIKYHKSPDVHPVTRQLLENIRDKTREDTEKRTVCKLLRELHYRCRNYVGAHEAFVLILRWHCGQKPQCKLCTNGMFSYP